jgi:hypothetical protein
MLRDDSGRIMFKVFRDHSPYDTAIELGPFNGLHTVLLAPYCKRLICLEARRENIEAAKVSVAEAGLINVDFILGDIEAARIRTLANVIGADVIFASGVLYHLFHPINVLSEIGWITELCIGWTHLAETVTGYHDGYEGRWFPECDNPLAGMSPKSWWMTPDEFVRAWSKTCGMVCRFLTVPASHENGGLAAEFYAERI